MALQHDHPAKGQTRSIGWATTWARSRNDRNDDWHGFAAITGTQLLIARPKETRQPARGLQIQMHEIMTRAAASGRSMEDFSKLDHLIRQSANTITIERGDIVAIQALAKGNLIRIRTTRGMHVVGGFSHKQDVTRVAHQLSALLAPHAEPKSVARPKLTGDLLRPLAVAPAVVALFFMLAVGVRIAIDGQTRSVTTRSRSRLAEETLGAIPIPILCALALMTIAALIVRITFRARDEVIWTV